MNRLKVTATNIKWDTDEDKQLLKELPKEIEIPFELLDDAISDYLSDITGFCHKGFSLNIDKR